MDVQAYPLQWPVSVPRTPAAGRKRSDFGRLSWDMVIRDLRSELKRLGANREVISTNQPVRLDGMPYAQQRNITDPGVAVYFLLDGATICLPCDRFSTLNENLRAVVKHIEAMRGMQRWGVGTAKQAFAGYKALAATAGEDPWAVLGLKWEIVSAHRLDFALDEVNAAHRKLARTAHPDAGGSAEQMSRINVARDAAIEALRGRS